MLREFSAHRPQQVARFVKTLFKGQFVIAGVGEFAFDNGKVLVPDVNNREKLNVYRQINKAIETLSA
ncbi:DUF1107 family protein [Vibrio hepatarius]|uniref:DUF1107 domain-containing protein n=1 Tax=Vibrio hepatarius TaxID=171383 RepID=A0A0M0HVS8_9VIBR|nr:DUF1107 family protein [Vibrio hepatarius]KOO06180.1 hypothetical protein AKJ31_18990 [Vibrio hepatarius]NOI15744.1 DUF1107 family protein [Vibrio hepatarius]